MSATAATALIGMEFEREALHSADRESQIDQQRLDFERLYAVSATLARAESLSEIVPHLVGTICKYLDAQVGLVLLYNAERHRLAALARAGRTQAVLPGWREAIARATAGARRVVSPTTAPQPVCCPA